MAPSTAMFTSASSSTMLGLLPPSSRVSFLMLPAAILCTCRPTSVEPVNEILSISGLSQISAPTVAPPPTTTLSTPGGSPASSAVFANSRHVSGV